MVNFAVKYVVVTYKNKSFENNEITAAINSENGEVQITKIIEIVDYN